MIINGGKLCDCCNVEVAERGALFFKTKIPFKTIKCKAPPVFDEHGVPRKQKIIICDNCFHKLLNVVLKEREKNYNNLASKGGGMSTT